MSTAESYRERAAELRADALGERDLLAKQELESLALRYLRLADEVDQRGRRSH